MKQIRYKVINKKHNKLSSLSVQSKANINYEVGKWVTSPKWLRKKGYYPFVFNSITNVLTYSNLGYHVYKCEVKDRTKLKPFLDGAALSVGKIVQADQGFPEGTEMWKEVKLLEEV